MRNVSVTSPPDSGGAENALIEAAARFAVRGLHIESAENALTPLIGKNAPPPLLALAAEMRAQAPDKTGLRRLGSAMIVRTPTSTGAALIWISEGPLASGHEQIESFSRLALLFGRGETKPSRPDQQSPRSQAAEALAETPGAGKRRWLRQAAAAIGARTGWANVAVLEIQKGRLKRVHAASRDITDRRADFDAFVAALTAEERHLAGGDGGETAAAAFYREAHGLDGFTLYAPVDGFGIYVEARTDPSDLNFVADLIERRRTPPQSNGRWVPKVLLGAVAAAALVYAALPAPMMIGAPAELRPAVSELQVSLHEARLLEVRVKVGDRVKAGDILAVLTSPQLKTAEEQAALDVILEQMNAQQALGEDDFAAYDLARQRGEILELRADQSRRHVAELSVRATVDGRIADVVDRTEIGAVLAVGAVIAEVQRTGEMNALLTLDATDGARLAKGMAGEVLLRGVIDRAFPVTLIEDPVLMTKPDGTQALTVLTELEGESGSDLYKGLSGFAQITGADGPRALNYFRPLQEFIELTIWKYTGWRL